MDGQDNQPRRSQPAFQVIQFLPPNAVEESQGENPRSLVHSHAARIAHARTRRARTREYQAARAAACQGQARAEQAPHPDPLQQGQGENVAGEALALYQPALGGSGRSDPFTSFARPLTPQENFLLDHCELRNLYNGTLALADTCGFLADIAFIIPRIKNNCRGTKARGQVYADTMTREWVQLGLSDPDALNSMFLNAARHLAVSHPQLQQQERYAELAVRYKVSCVRAVSQAIQNASGTNTRAFSDTVFAETLALAFDEVHVH